MPRLRTNSIIVALLIVSGACSKPPAAPPASGSPTATPSPLAASNLGISEPEAALLQACEKGDLKTVRELLDKGVNVNASDKDGRRPIIEASYWQHADIVRLLIDKGTDVNAKKVDGTTALDFAISLRSKEIEQILRQAGAKGDQRTAPPARQEATASPVAKTK
jgi:ankyrin repeat protein